MPTTLKQRLEIAYETGYVCGDNKDVLKETLQLDNIERHMFNALKMVDSTVNMVETIAFAPLNHVVDTNIEQIHHELSPITDLEQTFDTLEKYSTKHVKNLVMMYKFGALHAIAEQDKQFDIAYNHAH